MIMATKSGKPDRKAAKNKVTVTENSITITLTSAQKKKVKEKIRKSGVAKFKIKEIKITSIPSIQVGDKPVQI